MPRVKTNRDGCRPVENGKWEINFRPYLKAKRVYRHVNAGNRREACRLRAEEIAKCRSDNNVPQHKNESPTLGEIRAHLLRDFTADKLASRTISRYLLAYDVFSRFLAGTPEFKDDFNKVTPSVLNEYKMYLCEALNRSGIRTEFTQLRAIFSRLLVMGYCRKEILEGFKAVKKPTETQKIYRDIDDESIRRLLGAIKADRKDYYGITYVIHRIGSRIGETTLIRKEDIRFDDSLRPVAIRIRGENTKTKTEREIEPLDKEFQGVLIDCCGVGKSEWLFPNRNGRKHNYRHYEEYLAKKSMEVIGVRLVPHDFRHRFCTEALKKGTIADVQRITGHKDPNVLLKYYSHSTTDGRNKVLSVTKLGV